MWGVSRNASSSSWTPVNTATTVPTPASSSRRKRQMWPIPLGCHGPPIPNRHRSTMSSPSQRRFGIDASQPTLPVRDQLLTWQLPWCSERRVGFVAQSHVCLSLLMYLIKIWTGQRLLPARAYPSWFSWQVCSGRSRRLRPAYCCPYLPTKWRRRLLEDVAARRRESSLVELPSRCRVPARGTPVRSRHATYRMLS